MTNYEFNLIEQKFDVCFLTLDQTNLPRSLHQIVLITQNTCTSDEVFRQCRNWSEVRSTLFHLRSKQILLFSLNNSISLFDTHILHTRSTQIYDFLWTVLCTLKYSLSDKSRPHFKASERIMIGSRWSSR
jgi:hypothetical protein